MTAKAKPILILGSTGCVGRALAAVWPCDVPVIWQRRPRNISDHNSRHQLDGSQAVAWDILHDPLPSDLPPLGGIVVLTGVVGADPTGQNAALARVACDLGQQHRCRVLVASSQAVYGAAPTLWDATLGGAPLREDQASAPPDSYGAAKLVMEAVVRDHPHADACCLRIANVAGCDGLLKSAAAAAGPRPLDRCADGQSPQRNYIGPGCLADVLVQLMGYQSPLPLLINVAQPGVIAMQDLLQAAAVPFVWQTAPATALPCMVLDLERLADLVPLPAATPDGLIAQARAAGWRAAL
jgi:nucleoside-diphosphate-sugar epimerase